jgi:hypothetical protein
LRTLPGSLPVSLRYADGTRLEVGADSELRDLAAEEGPAPGARGKQVRLLKGSLRAVVARQPKSQPMMIETPHASLTVIGTILRIAVDPDPKRGTLLEVEEGKVEIRNLAGKVLDVSGGHVARAAEDGDFQARPLSALRKTVLQSPILDAAFLAQTAPGGEPLVPPWVSRGTATIGVDHNNGRGGSKNCAYLYEGRGVAGWSEISQTVSVIPNRTYTVSCFIQTSSPFSAHGLMGIRTTGGLVVAQQTFGKSVDYSPQSVRFNSGAAGSVVIFAGFSVSPGQSASWIHVDDWSMGP